MTKIDFYYHVENKFQTACSLSAKAYARGMKVLAFCADAENAGHTGRPDPFGSPVFAKFTQ